MKLAINHLIKIGALTESPLKDTVAAIFWKYIKERPFLIWIMPRIPMRKRTQNFVITGKGGIVEIQGTAEQEPFSEAEFQQLLDLAQKGCTL